MRRPSGWPSRRRRRPPLPPCLPRSARSPPEPALGSTAMQTPLDAEHRALGGRMVDFAGWDMPIRYGSVLDEHRACRTGAVVFDVSHMGSLWVRGPGAVAALQGLLTNDLGRIGPGR